MTAAVTWAKRAMEARAVWTEALVCADYFWTAPDQRDDPYHGDYRRAMAVLEEQRAEVARTYAIRCETAATDQVEVGPC